MFFTKRVFRLRLYIRPGKVGRDMPEIATDAAMKLPVVSSAWKYKLDGQTFIK